MLDWAMCKSFNPEKDIGSLSGKTIIVTGGNTGLGKETVLQLAKHEPKEIFLAARTPSKAEAAIDEIKKAVPSANIQFLQLDLTSFESIKKAAEDFNSRSERLDILLNNAGVMALPYSLTKENYEIQLGTNHLGTSLLTKLLLPTLLKTAKEPNADVRVVNLSSEAHRAAPSEGIIYDQAALEKWSTGRRYGASKLANIYHARELQRRNPSLTVVSLHPGVIITDLYSSISSNNIGAKLFTAGARLATAAGVLYDVPAGAKNQIWAATAEKAEVKKQGYYLVPVGKGSEGSKLAKDEKRAGELWEWTEGEFKKHGF